MDDLKILREAWQLPEAPSAEAHFRARTALTSRTVRRRRGRTGVRVAAVGALAVAIAAAITVAQNIGDGHGIPVGPVANAAEALDRAAQAAEAQHFTAPRPDQWLYTEEKVTNSAKPAGFSVGPPYVTRTLRHWDRADGKGAATAIGNGRIKYFDQMPGGWPPRDYPSLAALPTQPTALLNWTYQQAAGTANGSDAERSALAFTTLTVILRTSVLPPKVEAAIFRTLKTLPGVTLVRNAADVAGRPALALAIVVDDWTHDEVLLDRKSYAYMGQRSITIKDRTMPADDRGTGKTIVVKKGTIQVLTVRLADGVVDRPGQHP